MTTTPITAVTSNTNYAAQGTKGANQATYENEDFMTLLLAQLKNQDPMKPMDSESMMGQLAQLNSLNALQTIQKSLETMNKSYTMTYAASLIGKTITSIPDKNDPTRVIQGVVRSMTTLDGVTTVQVEDEEINLDSIVEVTGG